MLQRPAAVLLAVMALSAPASAQGQTSSPGLKTHIAGYTIQISPTNQSVISGGRGVLQLEWRRDCDGISYTQDSAISLNYPDGDVVDTQLRIINWESNAEDVFRFSLESRVAGETTETVNGLAARNANGRVDLRYSEPEPRTMDLPAGVVFPVQQIHRMFRQAEAQKVSDWYPLLRGEAENDPVQVAVTYIGSVSPPQGFEDAEADLVATSGWRFASAYYESKASAEPSFEIEETILASGVITQARISYPDMILDVKLERVQPVAMPDCSKAN